MCACSFSLNDRASTIISRVRFMTLSASLRIVVMCSSLFSCKQPIMRTENRLFDRGWVRSAMATRKCGNILWPSGRFLRGFVFKNYLGWGGQNISLKISSGAQSEDLEPSRTIEEFFSKKYSWFYMQRTCTLFG